MARKSGLGKGLGALIPAEANNDGSTLRDIPVGNITPNRFQPREHFDEDRLAALAASIAAVGVIQPVVVRALEDGFELIAGERRWRAAKRVGLATIPALVRGSDDEGSLETAVVENLHRQDLNPLEEAAAYRQLVDDFGLTQDDVASRVGKSRSAISNTIRLLALPPAIQRNLVEGSLSAGHARALLTLSLDDQLAWARRVVESELSVRQLEEQLRGPAAPVESANPNEAADRGDGGGAPKAAVADPRDPGVLELEELLAARLDTRVHVSIGKGTGRLSIEFADLDDLERIYHVIVPPGTNL